MSAVLAIREIKPRRQDWLAEGPGFQPTLKESESAVLPLNYPPTAPRKKGVQRRALALLPDGGSLPSAGQCREHGATQGNRVKDSCCNETCEGVVVPCGSFEVPQSDRV